MVTDTYAPARNGVAMWAALSVRELRARGHEVDVLTYAHDRRHPSEPGMHELPAWIGLDSDFKVAPILSGLPASMAGRAWDIVHIHHPILLGPHGVRLARACGAKAVFTCHSVYTDYLDEYYWGIGKPWKGLLNRRVARFVDSCDLALAPSTRVVSWLRECGVATRIEVLEAPADTARIHCVDRADARAALGLGAVPLALYVGRIADEKRVDVLVTEFASALDVVPDAMLYLIGRGVRVESVRRQISTARDRGPRAPARRPGGRAAVLVVLGSRRVGQRFALGDGAADGGRSDGVRYSHGVVARTGIRGPRRRAASTVCSRRTGRARSATRWRRFCETRRARARLAAGALERAGCYTPAANTDRMVAMYAELLA